MAEGTMTARQEARALGRNVRQARKAARLTQAELAQLAFRRRDHQGRISEYERGKIRPEAATLDALARATGFRREELELPPGDFRKIATPRRLTDRNPWDRPPRKIERPRARRPPTPPPRGDVVSLYAPALTFHPPAHKPGGSHV